MIRRLWQVPLAVFLLAAGPLGPRIGRPWAEELPDYWVE